MRNTQKALYEKRSAVLKNLHTAKVAAAKKRVESAKKLTKPTTKKPAVKKSAKSVKKSQKSSEIHQKAEAARAKFLKRFNQNRDGKVTKDEAKAVLAAEAKARAAAPEKKKK